MAEPQADKGLSDFCITYTLAVVAWNNSEESARDILTSLSEGGIGSTIAIYQLGNASLVDAIRTVCRFLRSIDNPLGNMKADHVEHFAEGLDRLRSYRNFYIHQLRGIKTQIGQSDYTGILFGLDVKQGYSYINHELSMEQLRDFTRSCDQLQIYGQHISQAVTRNALAKFVQPEAKPLASLEKPTWPERLRRTRESLLEPQPPHGA